VARGLPFRLKSHYGPVNARRTHGVPHTSNVLRHGWARLPPASLAGSGGENSAPRPPGSLGTATPAARHRTDGDK